MQKYTTTIEAQNNAFLTQLVGAQVSIYNFGTTTLATIYSDNGVTLATNPLISDSNGQISFYAANGRYSLTSAKVGYTPVSITDILLLDPVSPYAGLFTSIVLSGTSTITPAVANTGTIGTATLYWNAGYFGSGGVMTDFVNGRVSTLGLNTSGGGDIQWGRALITLGGGAAPTFGTIGGSGPATAAQNSWMRVIDSASNAFWVPVWK